MERSDIDVGNVHRYLRNAVFVYVPADCLASFQCARYHHRISVSVLHYLARQRIALSFRPAFLADVEGYGIGAAGGCGVEIEVHGNEEVPGADVACSAAGHCLIVCVRAEIRTPFRVFYLFRQCFIFASPAYRKVLSFRLVRSSFIAVARDSELPVNPFGELAGHLRAFFQCDT